MDAANLLKPALASGALRCIGATTFKEYRQHFEKDKALVRRFQKIDVAEPTVDDAIDILKQSIGNFADYHKVRYTPEAIETAVKMAKQYIPDRQLPDSAFDVVDEAGALFTAKGKSGVVNKKAIEETVSRLAKIPAKQVSSDDTAVLKDLDGKLKAAVFQQDSAIDQLASSIKLARAGMREPEKPIGSYVFTGPTGVGKTEVAKQLAAELGVPLIRFDMSEYMEKHTVSRLIGAPPGYVGFDQGGLLTDQIDQNKHCVLLLDEIEKAHPDLFNLLLQVMDHGSLTDNNGKKVDFRNVVLIMTTIAGAVEAQKNPFGFGWKKEEAVATATTGAIEGLFTPEFRNRLDAVVPFAALNRESIKRVAAKFIGNLNAQLADRKIVLNTDDSAMNYLAENGYDERMGARPMGRLIQEMIKKPLADEILFGRLKKGGNVTVAFRAANDDEIAARPDADRGPQIRFEFNDKAAGKPAKAERKALPVLNMA
jgi:ATP-dependent Clp protease ATP-binding subunit ClpA